MAVFTPETTKNSPTEKTSELEMSSVDDENEGQYGELISCAISSLSYINSKRYSSNPEGLAVVDDELPFSQWVIESISTRPETQAVITEFKNEQWKIKLFYADYVDFVLKIWSVKQRQVVGNALRSHDFSQVFDSPIFTDEDREWICNGQTQPRYRNYLKNS